MSAAVQDRLSGAADPIAALRQNPGVLWEVHNEPPALAFAELQLASRWEEELQARLRDVVREVSERIVQEMHEIAGAVGLREVKKLIVEAGELHAAGCPMMRVTTEQERGKNDDNSSDRAGSCGPVPSQHR